VASNLHLISEVRMMKYRLQLSPISGTRESHTDLPSRERWVSPFTNSEDARFFRSWLVYDSDLEGENTHGIRWNMILGLALAVIVSATIWLGVGLMIERAWK